MIKLKNYLTQSMLLHFNFLLKINALEKFLT